MDDKYNNSMPFYKFIKHWQTVTDQRKHWTAVTLNNASNLSGYRAIGPLLGYYWNYLCGVLSRLGSGMASWIV